MQSRPARAQNCTNADNWSYTIPTTGTVQWTSTDRGIRTTSPTSAKVFVAKGTTLYALWDQGAQKGQLVWSKPFSYTIETAPLAFPASVGGRTYVVVGAGGYIYVLDADSGTNPPTQIAAINTQRSGYLSDRVGYVPTIQLNAYANASYQSTVGADRIIVTTRRVGNYANVSNAVIAYDLSGNLKWQTNIATTVDGGVGCSLEYTTNTAYCGFIQSMTTQHSLMKLDTMTGALQWGAPVGSMNSPPVARDGYLFAVNSDATLFVLDAATGTRVVNPAGFSSTALVARPFYTEARTGGGFQYVTMFVDSSGWLYGASFDPVAKRIDPLWPTSPAIKGPSGLNVTDVPMLDVGVGRMYVPLSTGGVARGELATGAFGYGAFSPASAQSAVTPSIGGDGAIPDYITLSYQNTSGGTVVTRQCIYDFSGTGSRTSARTAASPEDEPPPAAGAPLLAASADDADGRALQSGADPQSYPCPCGTPPDPCLTGYCDGVSCVYLPTVPNGTACTAACGNAGTCRAGHCIPSTFTGGCACATAGGVGCAVGQACCGVAGCKDLSSDASNCGACGTVCASGFVCANGACKQPTCNNNVRPVADLNNSTNRTNWFGGSTKAPPPILLPRADGGCDIAGGVFTSGTVSKYTIVPPTGSTVTSVTSAFNKGAPRGIIGTDRWRIMLTDSFPTTYTAHFESFSSSGAGTATNLVGYTQPMMPNVYLPLNATDIRVFVAYWDGNQGYSVIAHDFRWNAGTLKYDYLANAGVAFTDPMAGLCADPTGPSQIQTLSYALVPQTDGTSVGLLYVSTSQCQGDGYCCYNYYAVCNAKTSPAGCKGRPEYQNALVRLESIDYPPGKTTVIGVSDFGPVNLAGDAYSSVAFSPAPVVYVPATARGFEGMTVLVPPYQTAYGVSTAYTGSAPPGYSGYFGLYGEDLYWSNLGGYPSTPYGTMKVPR